MPEDREALGRLVRETWVEWAREQPDPKPSWLVGWDGLDPGQREVDCRRHPDQQAVEDLAGHIRQDPGALRGHVVGVGTDGRLVAGQHVLHAIVLAGRPVRVTVRREGPDQGKSVST